MHVYQQNYSIVHLSHQSLHSQFHSIPPKILLFQDLRAYLSYFQFLIRHYTMSALLPPRRIGFYILILQSMFKSHIKEERTAAPFACTSLRLIDEDCLAGRNRKDLFQELLDEGEVRRLSPDSAVAVARQREWGAGEAQGEGEHPGCKCSKIDCLKLYCQCFAKGRLCNRNCICTGCQNHPGNCHLIYHAQQVANYRNPGHFHGVPAFVPARRCTCKKSSCRKNYCECYRAGVKCGEQCECMDCHNGNSCHQHHSSPFQSTSWMDIEKPIEITSTA